MLAFPIFVNIYILLMFFLFIRTDSIMFNLSKKDSQAALQLIDKVYDSIEPRDAILESLQSQVYEKPQSTLSTSESLFGRNQWRTTLYMSTFVMITQMTGFPVLNSFSNRIITVLNADVPAEHKIMAN